MGMEILLARKNVQINLIYNKGDTMKEPILEYEIDIGELRILSAHIGFKYKGIKKGDTIRIIDKNAGIENSMVVESVKYDDDIFGTAKLKFKEES